MLYRIHRIEKVMAMFWYSREQNRENRGSYDNDSICSKVYRTGLIGEYEILNLKYNQMN